MKHWVLLSMLVFCTGQACGDDDSPPSPIGGWSNATAGLHACFFTNGKLGFGDNPKEVLKPDCTWLASGTFTCSDAKGTWSISGETLTVQADSTCTKDCGPYAFQRSSTLTCPSVPPP